MASDLARTLTAAPLSPSERVVLYGERFTTAQILLGRTNDPQVPLLGSDVTVSSPQLGRAVLAAAFLAAAQADSIVLEPREKKQLFGLSSSDSLFATLGQEKVTWPHASLEARIRTSVEQAKNNDGVEVSELVKALVPSANDPWAAVVGQVIEGLRDRDLLTQAATTDTHLLMSWTLTDEAKRLVLQHDHAPVQQLISEEQENHPEIWERLNDQISTAIAAQTEAGT